MLTIPACEPGWQSLMREVGRLAFVDRARVAEDALRQVEGEVAHDLGVGGVFEPHADVEVGMAAGLGVRAADDVFGEFGRGGGGGRHRRAGARAAARAAIVRQTAGPRRSFPRCRSILVRARSLAAPPLERVQAFASFSSFWACLEACFACLWSLSAWSDEADFALRRS